MANKPVAALTAAAVLLSPVAANAACLQLDMLGTWQVYAFNNQDQWIRCKLDISRTGAIADTSCTVSNGRRVDTLQFTKGSVKLQNAAACTFTGQWTLGQGQTALLNKVVHATLA